jgi:hypothetical protein
MEFLFTQEQYKDIVNFEDFSQVYKLGLHDSLSSKLAEYIFSNDLEKEAMELANPNTRESAKLKYVEPEPPKYTWYYKDTNRFINKVVGDWQWYLDDDNELTETKFTEEEIDASPFKKEFFTKEK